MEGNENQVSSLFEQIRNSVTEPATASGVLGSGDGSHTEKKKRGRPRKYESPEEAFAAGKASSTLPGRVFTPHVVNVDAGEDVAQKIMLFIQQSRQREVCILSASGSVSNATLRHPAISGGSATYEGWFDIISLTGSYVNNELGGRSGGLSVCLSNTDGQYVGGGIAGPLQAASPVQVIISSFEIDPIKFTRAGTKRDFSISKSPPPPAAAGEPGSSSGFRPAVESSSGNTNRGTEEHQAIGGSHSMLQQSGVHVTPPHPSDWGGSCPDSRNAGFDLIDLNFDSSGNSSAPSPSFRLK